MSLAPVLPVLALALLSVSTLSSGGPDVAARGLDGAAWPSNPLGFSLPVTASANVLPDGSARGYFGLCVVSVLGCAGGLVDDVVPPVSGSALWCMSGPRDDAPGNRLVLWLVNGGDGVSTFDRYAYASGGPSLRCATVGAPANTFAFSAGDFKEVRVEVH